MQVRRNWAKAASSSGSVSSNNGANRFETATEIYRGKDEYYNGDLVVRCRCLEECRVVTSWTEANPSRRFHGCKNYGVLFLGSW